MHFNKIYTERKNDSDSFVHRLASFTVRLVQFKPEYYKNASMAKTSWTHYKHHQHRIWGSHNSVHWDRGLLRCYTNSFIHSFIHSIGMCRMRRFLAILRSFFHSSLLCTFSFHPSPPTILPTSLTHLAIYFLVYLLTLLFPNSNIIPFWEFYFLPFSVPAQTNVIYLTLLSLL